MVLEFKLDEFLTKKAPIRMITEDLPASKKK